MKDFLAQTKVFLVKWRMTVWFLMLVVIFFNSFVTVGRTQFGRNWHPRGNPTWMSQDATIHIAMSWDKTMMIRFTVRSYQRPRTLQLLVNGRQHSEHAVSPTQDTTVVLLAHLAQGVNTLTLHAVEGCDQTWQGDTLRCLSFAFSTPNITALRDVDIADEAIPAIATMADLVKYDEGWFDQEHDDERMWRWMTDRAVLRVFGNRSDRRERLVEMKLHSFYRDRTLQISLGNTVLFEGSIPTSLTAVRFPLPAEPLDSIVTLVSKDGCEQVKDLYPTSPDTRCLGFLVEGITIQRNAP